MSLTAKVENGKCIWDYPTQVVSTFGEFEGKLIEIDIKERSNSRSAQQNRYLFGVCYKMILKHLLEKGQDSIEVEIGGQTFEIQIGLGFLHEAMKGRFMPEEITDEGAEKKKRSSRLTKKEFNEYIEKIQRYAAATYGIVIPDPA